MKRYLILLSVLLTLVLSSATKASALTGSWRGELELGQMKLPLVFNFTETQDGSTEATLDSPAQGAKGISTEVTLCTGDSVSLTCNVIGASYAGRITSGMIKGVFTQRGYSFPLNLTPETPLEERRPQTPKPPYPYTVTDTTFTAPDGAVLSATLTVPMQTSSKKMPAVVMITGSGPQNRDEEIFEHRPFAVIADFLARNGIVSLRYDDRGTGKSSGNFSTATTSTFKEDAESGLSLLRGLPCVYKAGALGHSEGGTIALMLGAEKKADFIVSLAGMAVTGKETMMRQNSDALDHAGFSIEDKENSMKLISSFFDEIDRQHKQGESLPIDIDSIAAAIGVKVNPQIVSLLKANQRTRTPWLDALIGLNPQEYIKNIKCPLLAVNGEKDTQVRPDNLTVIKELAPHARIMSMPGLNHLMQHAATGGVEEYGDIRETISPEVLDAIVQFINSL